MPKAAEVYVRCIGSMNARLAKGLKYGIFAIIGILLIEAVSRYIFRNPTTWSIELGQFVFGTLFLIGGGYVFLVDGHVRMDAVYSRWSPKTRSIVDLITFSMLGVYMIVFIIGGFSDIEYTLAVGQQSSSAWHPPLAPIKIIMLVGAFLLFLQAIALFIRDIAAVKGKPIS
jgi:TRAP-type mannitol/chloroaromatic compound transport system permease small subunit